MSSLLRGAELGGGLQAHELEESDRPELARLVDAQPFVNSVLCARLEAADSLSSPEFGGTVIGVRDQSGRLTAAAFNGGNLLPVGGGEREFTVLGRHLAAQHRVCSSIVGPVSSIRRLWAQLASTWGPYRAIRHQQPLLVLESAAEHRPDPRVRQVRIGELDAFLSAAAAMFSEELGVSPYSCLAAADYRRRVGSLIRDGRAFAIFDDDGEVVFKADIGAVSTRTCQLQGVWVRPDLRGRGLGTGALAAAFAHALALAPTVSLYVNDFNTSARRMYATLGMRQVETLSTILF